MYKSIISIKIYLKYQMQNGSFQNNKYIIEL